MMSRHDACTMFSMMFPPVKNVAGFPRTVVALMAMR